VKSPLPIRQLPEKPDLDQLKRQARELLDAFVAGEPDAIGQAHRFYRDADRTQFALHQAQLVLARSYGFESWPKLKAFVDGVTTARLIETVRAGDVDRVRAVLRVRPELVNREAPSSPGLMALHYAVLERMPEMVRTLMQLGADPHVTTAGIYALRYAATPLAIATERGYEEIAAILQEGERQREDDGPTTADAPAGLRRAFETGDEDLVIHLLNRHPDLIDLPLFGERWSLLHIASALLFPRAAAWLLDHGANVNEPAGDGSTPLDVAGFRSDRRENAQELAAMVRLLRSRGAALTPRAAVILGDESFLRETASDEDLITPRDDRGWLLRVAVDCDRPNILKLLLDFGLDPDARVRVEDDDRITFSWGMPLYQCARYGKHVMAEMLLERGRPERPDLRKRNAVV
jgi:ankyrin repeat protein